MVKHTQTICPHKCFPANFAKFLRTPFLQNISQFTSEFTEKKLYVFFRKTQPSREKKYLGARTNLEDLSS